jgi:hypothetical protein
MTKLEHAKRLYRERITGSDLSAHARDVAEILGILIDAMDEATPPPTPTRSAMPAPEVIKAIRNVVEAWARWRNGPSNPRGDVMYSSLPESISRLRSILDEWAR